MHVLQLNAHFRLCLKLCCTQRGNTYLPFKNANIEPRHVAPNDINVEITTPCQNGRICALHQ